MKRFLISAIAIAVLIAGCGSGGSTTSVANQAKTTTSTTKSVTRHKKPKPHKKKSAKKHKAHKASSSSSSGGGAVTTAVAPAPTTTTTAAAPAPPPTTTQSAPTTTSSPAPVTTHQAPPPKHHHHTGGGGHGGGYCLSVNDRIDTPAGPVPVAQIQPGMRVWSTDAQGRRISVKVAKVRQAHVPSDHLMVRLRLADGRNVSASLSHPLPNGLAIRTLAVGQRFEGSHVVSDTRVRYGKPYTYDLLPAGSTHTYFADGVLLGSTIAPSEAFHTSRLF